MSSTQLTAFSEYRQRMTALAKESEAYAKVAEYLTQHLREVPFLTASTVAQRVGTSQATVSRFCADLGFGGYGDFARAMQAYVREELTAPQRLRYAVEKRSIAQEDPVLESERQHLDEVGQVAESDVFARLARRLAEAEHVLLVAARASATLLPYFAYFLGKIRRGVTTALPSDAHWSLLPLESPQGTQVMTLAFPRYPRVLIQQMQRLCEAGFSVATITDRNVSPAVRYADLALVVPVTRFSVFDAYGAPMVLLNLLLREVAAHTPDLKERLRAVERFEQQDHVYI